MIRSWLKYSRLLEEFPKACFYKQYTITQGECVRQKTQVLKKSGFVPGTRPGIWMECLIARPARQRPSRHGLLLWKKYLPSGNIPLANKKAFRLQMKSDFFIILIFFHQCCSFFLFHACHCCSFFFNIFLTFNIKRSFSDRSVQVLCRDKSRITEVF